MTTVATTRFSGRAFGVQEMTLIREVVRECSGLSRMELARTVCELLRWRRPNGRLKARECREFLERLDAEGALELPAKRRGRSLGSVTRVPRTAAGEPGLPLVGSVRDVEPLAVELVREPAQRLLFRELVGRYHYLGHTVPFGAHLRYLVFASRPQGAVVGCLQFSSLKLPQFRGHLSSWRGGGVHDAEVETAVPGGIPTADGRAGSVRTYTGGTGSGVRAVGRGDTKLGRAG